VVTAIVFAYMANCMASLIQFGRVWALFVPLIVSVNDTMAYVCGVTTGKTPLISLSPNKTLEGFVGGAVFTCIAAYFAVGQIFKVEWLACPFNHFSFVPFESNNECNLSTTPAFSEENGPSPAQQAVVIFGLFASIVGPFGGFLASGMKRAWQLKDFSNSLPGHGGFVDRFDCVSCLCVFSQIYMSQVLFRENLQYEDSLSRIQNLPRDEKLAIINWLTSITHI
jgi:phosphatidate cytidylyltransferase